MYTYIQNILHVLQYAIPVYVVLVILFYLLSDYVIFQPPSPPRYQKNESIQFITSKDGSKIATLYFINPEAKYTLLYSHGNAEDLGTIQPLLYYFVQHGFSVFAYDYEGYGLSSGKPSEQGAYRSIEAAFQHMKTKLNIPAENIIVYGSSVGSGPSVELASNHDVGALILQAPFASAYRVKTKYPIIPFDKFVNIKKMSKINAPLLIIHGKRDSMIPFWHSEKLIQAANSPKTLAPITQADHNNVIQSAGPFYWETIEQFISSLTTQE